MNAALTVKRLAPLIDVADDRAEDAMRAYAEQQALLAAQEQRLAELSRYLAEYAAAQAQSGGVALLRNRQAFVARLREAEAMQQRIVEQARRACDTRRAQWLECRRDLGVLDQLAGVYARREQRQHEQRTQIALDEQAAQRFSRHPHPGMQGQNLF